MKTPSHTYINPDVRHQTQQIPLVAATGQDGDELRPEGVQVEIVNFWDTFEVWKARKEWLADKRRMGR